VKSSGLLKWLMIPLAGIAVLVIIRLFSGNSIPTARSPDSTRPQLTAEEMKELGVGGDTPRDTVATLIGQVKLLRNEVKATVAESEQQKAENDRLRARESGVDQRVQDALKSERDRWRTDHEQASSEQQQTQSLLQDLQKRLEELGRKGATHSDLPVGLGLEGTDVEAPSDQLHWIEPQDRLPSDKRSPQAAPSTQPTSFQVAPVESADTGSEPKLSSLEASASDQAKTSSGIARHTLEPKYTVPANATLMGSVAMTALIGRVPVDGTVSDPFPFKIVIGAENLTANGIELPDVAGAIVSGTASGDWTLSCVRGQIRSVTFVFRDGTIRNLPSNSVAEAETNTLRSGLGWISDPYGTPCISGVRRSNARQFLTTQMLITAAAAGAAASVDSKSGSVSFINAGNGGDTLGTVGITAHEAAGRILAGGVQEIDKWVDRLYGQAFAAVYVPPAARVAVHIDQPLEIDYDRFGRKVRYDSGGDRVPDID
jgi:integrating conjugative element protein (TIGR03752 family)